MERHWATHCTGNTFCGVSYDEYLLKIKQKSTSGYIYDNEYALHRYKLWKQNAIKKIQRARKIAKKIQAVKVIQQKWLEIFYKPEGMCVSQLAEHYKLLWAIEKKYVKLIMHNLSNTHTHLFI